MSYVGVIGYQGGADLYLTLLLLHPQELMAGISAIGNRLRTGDIYSEGTTKVGTAQMGDAVVKALG